jgi:hypothetical protein
MQMRDRLCLDRAWLGVADIVKGFQDWLRKAQFGECGHVLPTIDGGSGSRVPLVKKSQHGARS